MSTRPLPAARPTRRDAVLGALCWLPLALGAGFLVFEVLGLPPLLNHDVAQYLTAGQRVLEGDRPFVELIDTNPPLVFYLSAVVVALAEAAGLPLALTGLLSFAGLTAAAFGLYVAALRRGLGESAWASVLPAAVASAAVWLHVAVLAYRDPTDLGLGQRDQLIGALLLPWAALRYARYAGAPVRPGLAATIGVGALVAVGMKPHYAVALALVELAAAWQARRLPRLRVPEVVALGVAGVIYALVPLVVPGMSAFYTRWLPFISSGYGAYDAPLSDVFFAFVRPSSVWGHLPPAVGVVVCTVLAAAGLRARAPTLRLASLLGMLALASALVVVLQHKGWHYHLLAFHLPALTALALAAAEGAVALVRRLSRAGGRAGAAPATPTVQAAALVAALASVGLVPLGGGLRARLAAPASPPGWAVAQGILEATAPGERVLPLTPAIPEVYPGVTLSGRRSAGRFLNAFPLIFFYTGARHFGDLGPWREEEARFYAAVLDDVRAQRPALVLVDTLGPSSTAAYLRWRGFYRAVAADYEPAAPIGPFATLRRRPTARPLTAQR